MYSRFQNQVIKKQNKTETNQNKTETDLIFELIYLLNKKRYSNNSFHIKRKYATLQSVEKLLMYLLLFKRYINSKIMFVSFRFSFVSVLFLSVFVFDNLVLKLTVFVQK